MFDIDKAIIYLQALSTCNEMTCSHCQAFYETGNACPMKAFSEQEKGLLEILLKAKNIYETVDITEDEIVALLK